ncbi:MAG: tetratricopeptide repeat protein [Bryobacteraceae bacterium]
MTRFLILLVALPLAAQTVERCQTLRRHGQANEARTCWAGLAGSGDAYLRAEGLWGQGRFPEANEQFKRAAAAQPGNQVLKVRWGRFYLERYNREDALQLFNEVLEKNKKYAPALLGVALVASEGFDKKAVELAEEAVKEDPKLTEARELLARLALEDGDWKRAGEQADLALAISNEALDAMAVHATVDWVLMAAPAPGAPTPWIDKVLKVNPRYGEAYALAARILVLNRRYVEGIAFFQKALELSPELWDARSEMGVNQMRLGQDEEARRNLELCYANGYRNAATVNSLRLLDSYKNFVFLRKPRTVLKLHKKEAAVLGPYMQAELDRAIATYDKKYKMTLPLPVQLEVYPDHEDFAVRTVGMPGVGLLGVTFGMVVAMDSPSGRPPGSFHWASTMWHELSHVYVLTATHHRVPRWFTEGMAVHEETSVSPEWGDRMSPEIIDALKKKKLLPVAQLDRGFVRPSYPAQILVSYYQAGKVCDFIAERWSYDKLLDMMHGFGEGKQTPDVLEAALGMKAEAFDELFLAWINAQTKKTVDGYDEWQKRRDQLVSTAKQKTPEEVLKEGAAVREIYPEYVEEHSVYEFLGQFALQRGDKKTAMSEFERYARAGGRSPDLLKKLAGLEEEAGDRKAAAQTLQRLNYIYPVQDEELHKKLGDLWMELGNVNDALIEYEVALASKPMDPAGAHFRFAQALKKANRGEQAQEQLMLALEIAPGYRPAQKMLLELNSKPAVNKD